MPSTLISSVLERPRHSPQIRIDFPEPFRPGGSVVSCDPSKSMSRTGGSENWKCTAVRASCGGPEYPRSLRRVAEVIAHEAASLFVL